MMRITMFRQPAGEFIRQTEKILNSQRTREVIHFFFQVVLGFALGLVLLRTMPYDIIKEMRSPFIKLENVLYVAMILFIVLKSLDPSDKTRKFLAAPIGTGENDEFRYQKQDMLIVVVLFLFNVAYLLIIYDKEIPNLDEGWILTMSDRILRNDIPYRDFFTLTSPGSIYLNAWIFKVFGASIIVERAITLILASLGSIVIYLLARLAMGFFFSVSTSLLFLAWQFPAFFQASYSWYAIFWSICAFLVMGLIIQDQNRGYKRLMLVGFLCGICFMFKQNVGAFTLIAISLYFPAEQVLFDGQTKRGLLFPLFPSCFRLADITALIKKNILLFLGFAIPLGVCAYAFYSKGALTDFVQGVFVIPMQNTQEYHTPYEPLTRLTDKRVMMYMPHFMMLVTFGVLLSRFRRSSLQKSDRFPLLMLLAALLSLLSTYPRADFIHIVFSLWPSLILFVYWTQQLVTFIADKRPLTAALPTFAGKLGSAGVLILACIPLMIFFIHRTDKNISFEDDLVEINTDRGRGIYANPCQVADLDYMISFVEAYSDCGKPEVVFSTTPLLYFLMDWENPIPYDYILAGNGPPGYEDDILDFLKNRRPCMIVIDTIFTDYYPIAEDWHKIEKYISSTYEIGFDSARYKVLLPPDSIPAQAEGEAANIVLRGQNIVERIALAESIPTL